MITENAAVVSMPSTGQETATEPVTNNDNDNRYEGFESLDNQGQETATETVETQGGDEVASQTEADDIADEVADPWDGYEDFEMNGKVYKIPSDIKDGYLRQKDYTQKTQEVAETRRQIEAREQELNQRYKLSEDEFNAHVALANIGAELKRFEGRNWNAEAAKLADDPLAFQELQREHMRFQELREYQKQFSDFTNQAAAQRTELAQQETVKRLTATREFAATNIKGWTPELDEKITDFAIKVGQYTREALQAGLTPQNYRILHLAYLGHQSQLRQTSARPNGQTKPLAATQTVSAKANAPVVLDPDKMSMEDYAKARAEGRLK